MINPLTSVTATLAAAALAVGLAVAGCASSEPAPAQNAARAGAMPFSIDKVSESFDGVAAQVLQVPSYTYVAVQTDGGDVRWAVSLKERDLREGARVHVRSFGEKERFESKKLGRTFDRLSFAVIHPVTEER